MREKLANMTYAELPHGYDAWEHLVAGMYDEPVVVFGNGKRSDAVQASLFDAIHAEMLGERMAEKCKVRSRRACERKARVKNPRYVKRNGGNWSRSVHYEGDKGLHYPESLRMPERKADSKAESAEKDWLIECGNRDDALAEHSDYLDMAIDHGERLEYLRKRIAGLEYVRITIEELNREAKYEQNRVNDMMRIADMIMEGECY